MTSPHESSRSSPDRLVGMVHLAPLPGAPGYGGSMDAVLEDAVSRATALASAGFRTVMVENFGDVPFYGDEAPPVTVAAMATSIREIRRETGLTIGVNVLRNDARSALGVAAATGASFIRVNVLTGMMLTDQGPLVGKAAEVVRRRSEICPGVAIWADVFVKHAAPPPGLTVEQAASDTWDRGGADALIVSGTGTGHAPDLGRFQAVRSVVEEAPLVVGSGATPDNLGDLAAVAEHIIVGTALERDGHPGAELDPARVASFVEAASSHELL